MGHNWGKCSLRIQIQCMWVLTVRGYFTATEALERAGEKLNGTSFRVGTWTFLSLPKQNIFTAKKDNLCSLFTDLRGCRWHCMGRWTRTLLLFAFHQSKGGWILQISAPNYSAVSGLPNYDLGSGGFSILEKQLFGFNSTVAFILLH